MIVSRNLDARLILRHRWPSMRFLVGGSVAALSLYYMVGPEEVNITVPLAILGTALSILLGFKNNNAYDRWWEARQLWGRLVNNSRNLAARVLTLATADLNFGGPEELSRLQKQIIYRHLAFVYALKHHLRQQEPWESLQPFLSEADFVGLRGQQNVPNALLMQQQLALQQLHAQGYLDGFRHMQLDGQLAQLYDVQGGCERIKNTVFPRQYTVYTCWAVRAFLFLLPIGMGAHFGARQGWLAGVFSLVIGFVFAALEYVGNHIENPFDNTSNDTPMSALARTIEINLRQNLGETELPASIQPENGNLY